MENNYINLKETEVSLFMSIGSNTPIKISLYDALRRIEQGEYKTPITLIRESVIKEGRDKLKRSLAAVVFAGYYKNRKELVNPSGLACLDFDKVTSLDNHFKELRKSKYILAYWLSPSGNGIKALVRVPLVFSKESYSNHYKAILRRFKTLSPDPSTKDMNRLCFESYDPDLYLNPHAMVFTDKVKTPQRAKVTLEISGNLPEGKKIDRILKWWVKNFNFKEGARNNNLFILACTLSEFGITSDRTKDLLNSFECSDFTTNEINSLIKSAYAKTIFNSKTF